jgi:two-component system, OmpR family, sensor histidine kinase TctE
MTDRIISLRRRLVVWLIIATVGIGALALVDTRAEAVLTAQQVSDRVLVGAAMAIAEGVTVDANGGLSVAIPFSALDMVSSTAQDRVFYRVDGPDGFLTGYSDLSRAPLDPLVVADVADDAFRGAAIRKATVLREVTTGADILPFAVTVAETTLARDQLSSAILQRSAARIAGLIAVAALVAWAAATLALRPLDRMSQRIALRAPHDLSPIEGPAPKELLPVLGALNSFLSRLQRSMSAIANFSSNANHQIRTPLTVARTQIELAKKTGLTDQAAVALGKADAALIRTERVLEQLLLLARVEASGARPALANVDVAALARTIAEEELSAALQKDQDLGYEGPARLEAVSEEILLGELLRNLVSNALRHCPAGSSITIRLQKLETGALISVLDNGPGLPDAQFEKLRSFVTPGDQNSFVRAGQHGLGLHIVREIADAVGAVVTLQRNIAGQGLCFGVLLPG